jgi:creatinine amidohydrolase
MQESIHYTELRWPELKSLAEQGAIVLLPIGQTEEHGPHLPVGCDYMIAVETARAVAEKASKELPVLMLPGIWAGYSGRDLFAWPGVLSKPPELVIAEIEHLVLSLGKSGFKKVVTLNSHGHHDSIARVAARKVADQSDVVMVVTDIWRLANDAVTRLRESPLGGCCHACEYETSLLLHFGKRVDMKAAVDEPVKPHSKLVSGDNFGPGSKVFWSTWRYQKSRTGTFGCPTLATAEKGKAMFEETVAAYVSLLRELHAAK